MTEITKEELDRIEALQREMHTFINYYKSLKPDLPYDTLQITFILYKLARLELKSEFQQGAIDDVYIAYIMRRQDEYEDDNKPTTES